jgi:hypothetical protein
MERASSAIFGDTVRPSSNSRAPTAAANLGREHQTVRRKAPREHCGKCGGRARQPRGPLTGCLWELPPAFACRGSHAPPRSGACRLTARHGGANSAQGTQGAPRKMRRQGAATPGSTHRVSVGCAPSLHNGPAPKFVQSQVLINFNTDRCCGNPQTGTCRQLAGY